MCQGKNTFLSSSLSPTFEDRKIYNKQTKKGQNLFILTCKSYSVVNSQKLRSIYEK